MQAFGEESRSSVPSPDPKAGRRDPSRAATTAVLETGSVVRRTMRDTRAGRRRGTTAAAGAPVAVTQDGPQAARLRAKLRQGPHERAVLGARLLLELAEPETLMQARRFAFPIGNYSPEADAALREAWDRFRHDRYRAVN